MEEQPGHRNGRHANGEEMKRKNLPKQKIVRIGDVEYVPAPNLDGVPRLRKPGTPSERRTAAKKRSKRPRPP